MAFQVSVNEEAFSALLGPILSEHFSHIEKKIMAQQAGGEKLYDVPSLADYLSVSKDWVYGMVRKREIPYFKVGSNNRFRKKEIDQWLDDRLTKPLPVNPVTKTLSLLGK